MVEPSGALFCAAPMRCLEFLTQSRATATTPEWNFYCLQHASASTTAFSAASIVTLHITSGQSALHVQQ